MLSDQDKQILEQLRQAKQQRDQVPASQRQPITNADKYSFPIGVDDQGQSFPQSAGQSRAEKKSTPSEDQSKDTGPANS